MLGYIKEVKKLVGDKYKLEVALDSYEDEQLYVGHVSAEQFGAQKTLNNILGYTKTKDLDLFDFGHALTVYKAQGSQAKKVVFLKSAFPATRRRIGAVGFTPPSPARRRSC